MLGFTRFMLQSGHLLANFEIYILKWDYTLQTPKPGTLEKITLDVFPRSSLGSMNIKPRDLYSLHINIQIYIHGNIYYSAFMAKFTFLNHWAALK